MCQKKNARSKLPFSKPKQDWNAKTDLERIENLYAAGAVSKQTLDATRTGATVAEAQYEAASQQLKLVETGARDEDILAVESQVRQAESALDLARSMTETRSWEKDIEMAQAGYDQAKAGLETAEALEPEWVHYN